MNPDKIPAVLRDLPQWVNWKTVERDGKSTKIPVQPNGEPAKSDDSSTWHTFEDVSAAPCGFVFAASDPFCGVDLDGCRDEETGQIAEWARSWINRFNSYTEVSPSGTGVKIFVRGQNPRSTGKNKTIEVEQVTQNKKPGVEIYDHKRFFAVTGQRLRGVSAEIESRQNAINAFCDEFWPVVLPDLSPSVRVSGVTARARKYLEKLPPSISGQGGHNAAFRAACVLVLGFGLPKSEALGLLSEWNVSCQPPWSERELVHKVESASQQPGERNYLRDVKPNQWHTVDVPTYEIEPPKLLTLQQSTTRYLDALKSGKTNLVDLGIADVDYATGGGVAFGEMVILAARPSHGKSAVALQCLDTATRNGMPGLLVSEEMSAMAIGKRAIQFATESPEEHWRTSYTEVERDLTYHFDRRQECYIAEGCRSVDRVCEVVDHAVAEHGVKVVAVDYAQLLSSKGKGRYEQITNTSIALRQLANRHQIVLLVLAQLNRQVEGRPTFLPKMSDLRDSGQLEQDADVVLLLAWPHRIDSKKDPHQYLVFVAKNRNRPINQAAVECRFFPSRQMFLHQAREVSGRDSAANDEMYSVFDEWNQ